LQFNVIADAPTLRAILNGGAKSGKRAAVACWLKILWRICECPGVAAKTAFQLAVYLENIWGK